MADRLTGMLVFLTAAELGSFAAAAGRLGMSAQMAGRYVAQLEDRLGTRLLNRSTHSHSLTEAGEAFLDGCRKVLAEVELAESTIADHVGAPRGTLRVSAPVGIGSALIAPRIQEFLNLHPALQVELALSDRMVNLIDERFDVAVRTGDLPDSTLLMRVIGSLDIVTCASPGYLAAHGTPVMLTELARHRCLGRSCRWAGMGGQVPDLPQVGRLLIDDDRALVEAALSGSGIIRVGEPLVRRHVDSGQLVRVLAGFDGPRRPLQLVFTPHKLVTPKLRAFVDWLTQALAEFR